MIKYLSILLFCAATATYSSSSAPRLTSSSSAATQSSATQATTSATQTTPAIIIHTAPQPVVMPEVASSATPTRPFGQDPAREVPPSRRWISRTVQPSGAIAFQAATDAAIIEKEKNEVTQLLKRPYLINTPTHGFTPLLQYLAIPARDRSEKGRAHVLDIVQQLVEGTGDYKADLEAAVSNVGRTRLTLQAGLTPLLLALKNGYYDVALYLIQQGANVKALDSTGNTALIIATQNPNTPANVFEALLEAGADLNAINTVKKTVLDYATAEQTKVIKNYLDKQKKVKGTVREFLQSKGFPQGVEEIAIQFIPPQEEQMPKTKPGITESKKAGEKK